MYYSIGEISSVVNISKDTLRYYDETGVLKPCMVDPENGYRYYSHEQVKTIAGILEYKEYGFTLEQVKTLLACNDAEILHAALQKQHEYLSERMRQLAGTLARLKNRMEVNTMEKKKIMIVDDAEFMRKVLTEILANQGGFAPIAAESGEEALRIYESEKPWLVLMDIAMPGGMDGIKCTEKIRALDADAQIVMLSARDDDKNQKAAQEAGACGFISKPFKGEDLLDFISNRQSRFVKATNFHQDMTIV